MKKDLYKLGIDHINEFLTRQKENHEALLQIKEIRDRAIWDNDTTNNMSDLTNKAPPSQVFDTAKSFNNTVINALVISPKIELHQMSSVTASSSGDTLDYITQIGNENGGEYRMLVEKAIIELEDIHNKYHYPNRILELVDNVFPSQSARFLEAKNEFFRYFLDYASERSSAIPIRTFIGGILGELWKLAKRNNEQKMNLELIFQRLFSTMDNAEEIKKQFDVYPALVADTSAKGKDYNGESIDIKSLWQRALVFTEIVSQAMARRREEQN